MTKVVGAVFVGIDVVALERDHQLGRQRREFPNTAAGHKLLIQWLSKSATAVQVCLEATGLYSLDLALALDRAEGIEVMVANPRAIADFAKALLQRSKTDQLDADVMLEFVRRMPFVPWQAPKPQRLDLRALMRRITGLKLASQQEKNRLHSVSQSAEITPLVRKDIQSHLVQLERHVEKLEQQAEAIVQAIVAVMRKLLHALHGMLRTGSDFVGEKFYVIPS